MHTSYACALRKGHATAVKIYQDGFWVAHKRGMVRLDETEAERQLAASLAFRLDVGAPTSHDYGSDPIVGMDAPNLTGGSSSCAGAGAAAAPTPASHFICIPDVDDVLRVEVAGPPQISDDGVCNVPADENVCIIVELQLLMSKLSQKAAILKGWCPISRDNELIWQQLKVYALL